MRAFKGFIGIVAFVRAVLTLYSLSSDLTGGYNVHTATGLGALIGTYLGIITLGWMVHVSFTTGDRNTISNVAYWLLACLLLVGAGFSVYVKGPGLWNEYGGGLKTAVAATPSPPTKASPVEPAVAPSAPAPSAPTTATSDSPAANSTPAFNTDHIKPVAQPDVAQPDATTNTATITNAAPELPKVFVPPDPLPQQPDWTWVVRGQFYTRVVVKKVEADQVTIDCNPGPTVIDISLLDPETQKKLHYDPYLASVARDERRKKEAAEAAAAKLNSP